MEKPLIDDSKITELYMTKYVKLYGIEIEKGVNYLEASRHKREDLTVTKSDEEFKKMIADAVTCAVIVKMPGKEPGLLLTHEYRYPVGQYLLSPTAGLVDKADKECENPLIATAKREIFEEMGIKVKDSDKVFVVSQAAFSSPGLTDESNGIVCAIINLDNTEELSHDNAEGLELFKGFTIVDKNKAKEILKSGKDDEGNFFSVYTWAVLMYFYSGLWEEYDC